jgi:hypothetical protein
LRYDEVDESETICWLVSAPAGNAVVEHGVPGTRDGPYVQLPGHSNTVVAVPLLT